MQHHIHVFLIFWGPAYKTNPSRVVSAQETLFSTLARSTYNGILDQYYDTSGQITNDVSLTDVWIDPVASTAAVGENSALAEVDRAIKLNSWPTKLNDQFLVIPHGRIFENDCLQLANAFAAGEAVKRLPKQSGIWKNFHEDVNARAQWTQNGKTITQNREIRLQAGDQLTVDFTRPRQAAPPPPPSPMRDETR